jgi:hypothetical protein
MEPADLMWVKVLPADMAKESYWEDIPDPGDAGENEFETFKALRDIIAGDIEIVKTQTLVNKYGIRRDGWPKVVMVVNELGNMHQLPINKRASAYYPNDYDLPIRGTAVLIGQEQYFSPEDGPYYSFGEFPKKWKIIYDMETALADDSMKLSKLHETLDNLLLEAADEDVAEMYREARNHFVDYDWNRL